MASPEAEIRLRWQSKGVLLVVLPFTAISAVVQARWWWLQVPSVAYITLGVSSIFGLIVWRLRAGTPAAAATGAAITASLMFATVTYPYESSWRRGGLLPELALFLLTFAATRTGRAKKEHLGTGEGRRGRSASQVAANLGVAALAALSLAPVSLPVEYVWLPMLAALAEATADTVSSELGQVFGGQPRLCTTWRRVEPGTDGAITLIGTAAGALGAAIVAAIGVLLAPGMHNRPAVFLLAASGGVFGLLFDSLLGATLEKRGWLNNDAVNFLSTAAAAAFAFLLAPFALASFPQAMR
jgi:uncharacterized protein (TIGR00297 family)